MDPAKMKVVELRAALLERNLDTKGNKPVLVKRLKEALEAELETTLPDTSIVDTSIEDIADVSPVKHLEEFVNRPDRDATPVKEVKDAIEVQEVQPPVEPEAVVAPAPSPQKVEAEEAKAPDEEEQQIAAEICSADVSMDTPTETTSEQIKDAETCESVATVLEEQPKSVEVHDEQSTPEQNGDNEEDCSEPKAKKSRWASETKAADAEEDTAALLVQDEGEPKVCDSEQRGEKRKHSTPSPERNARRSKSPTREDEPVVDSNAVQLSWYDSDLHLQIDKTNFLSAKPLHEGLFGYIWSGARFTYGIAASKACFEVKITEELKFDDIFNARERDRHDRKESHAGKRDDCERSRTKSENDSEPSLQLGQDKDSDENNTKEEIAAETTEPNEQKTELADSTPADALPTNKPDEIDKDESTRCEANEEKSEKTDEAKDAVIDSDTSADAKMPELAKLPSHLIRIGWSVANSSLQLGEDPNSFAFESSGKFISNKIVSHCNANATFKVGDVVRAFVDVEKLHLAIAVNGNLAFEHQIVTPAEDCEKTEEFVLFPHILTRNYAFEVNVGEREEPFSSSPPEYEDYQFVSKIGAEMKVQGAISPEKREDCEVIMMWGLPGAGKTHWVKEHIENSPLKKYNVIGNSFLLERMTVDCESFRSKVPQERLNFFWSKLTKSVNRLSDLAALRRRDFILDQTNVFPAAIRRKMRSFLGFKRRAVVVINDDDEQEKRQKLQDTESCKEQQKLSNILEMKVNMSIPKVGELFETVTFSSLPEDKAQEQVQKYNKQGREGSGQGHRRDYREDRNNRWYRSGSGGGGGGPRRDYQYRNNYRDRPYQNNRYDRNYRQTNAGNNNWRPSSGGNNAGWGSRNDRRDNRGPRDWRTNNRSGGMSDRPQHRGSGAGGNRDHRSQNSGNGNNYNRNRSGGGGGGGGSSGGRGWGGQSSWNSSSGSWGGGQSQDSYTSGWNQSQGSWNQNHWKYGGGYNQGGYSQYPQNWNYYGGNNYSQDWGSNTGSSGQGQGQSGAQSSSAANTSDAHSSPQAQYAPQLTSQQSLGWQYTQYPSQNNASTHGNAQK